MPRTWQVLVVAVLAGASLAGREARADRGAGAMRPPALFALVIGVNAPPERSLSRLRYADDDAARYFDLFRLLGARVHLLSRLDPNTARLHTQATAEALAPTRAALHRTVRTLAAAVARARVRGVKTVLYFVYAGHGTVWRDQGLLTLEAGRVTGREVLHGIVQRVAADRSHLIVDACNATTLVNIRGPGGRRRQAHGFSRLQLTAAGRTVGLLLSDSAGSRSHEWQALQAGVFSHAVRSAMLGAADANSDKLVSYREVAAFVDRANKAIPNEKFRSRVYARPPRDGGVLVDLRRELRRHLEVGGQQHGRYLLEDSRGVRLVDFHNSPRQTVRILRPPGRQLYLRRLDIKQEYAIAAGPDVIRLATLHPRPPRTAARGAAHQAFSRLFEQPFDAEVVARFRLAPHEPVQPEASRRRAGDAGRSGPRWRHIAGWSVLGVGTAAVASGLAMTLRATGERDGVDHETPGLERGAVNQRIDRYNVAAVALYSTGGAAMAAGLLLLLWPDAAPPAISTHVSPDGALVSVGGNF